MGRLNAVDTNIIARYILQDDPKQAAIATKLLAEPCFASDTVLVELAWLLSSRYGVGRADLAATLHDLLRLPALSVSNDALIGWAIDRFATGADFADMMHIVSAQGVDRFATFDQGITRDVGTDTPVAIETLA